MISLIIVIAIVGVVVWCITQAPMAPMFKNLIYAVVAICLLLWLLQAVGGYHLPRWR